MQPDQNQPPMPNINPPQPGAAPPEQPPQAPQPSIPAPPLQQPMTEPQVPQPAAPVPPVTPVIGVNQAPQQSTDPTQPGYIPPTSINPLPASQITPPSSGGRFSGKFRIAAIAVFVLLSLSGLGVLAKDTLFTGSSIKISDLVEEKEKGVVFKRPSQWTKIEDNDFSAAFTEKGQPIDDSDQGMGVLTQNLGGDLNSVSAEQKAEFETELKKEFGDKSKFEGDGCEEVSKADVTKIEHKNYPLAYRIEMICSKYTGRNVAGKMVGVIGVKGSNMDIIVVMAIDKTWEKSGDAFNEILDTANHE